MKKLQKYKLCGNVQGSVSSKLLYLILNDLVGKRGEIFEATVKTVSNNPSEWMKFLRSACRNYKCRFDEQILIYAQRPEATAVLEIEKWNKNFGRWVNKGATGIAVFDDEHNGNYRLKHYFDIADTHGSRFERPVPVWQMEQRLEANVSESLENSFGELEDKSSLAYALISTAQNNHPGQSCRLPLRPDELA